MKIFAVTNNYNSPESYPSPFGPGEIDWYELPDSSILRSGNPFYVPDFDEEFRAYPSIAFRIGRLGKSIAPRFASRYIDRIGMGTAVIATSLLKQLRDKGAPWTRATAFDRSLLLGNLEAADALLEKGMNFTMSCGGEKINYDSAYLQEDIDHIISRLSRDNTLKNGDIILAGLTPRGLLLKPGTRLIALKEHENITYPDNLTSDAKASETHIASFSIK